MRNNRLESSTGRPTTKLCCTGCGNEAHPKGVPCSASGKNCPGAERAIILLGRACPSRKPNHFGRQVRALESEPDPSMSHNETEATEEVYLYRVITEKSSNPTVTLEVNTIPVTLHIDTQADVTIMMENILRALKKQATSSRQKRS